MIQVAERKAKCTELKAYCHLSKPHDFMEVCEWVNGEGFDVAVNDDSVFRLTYGQWDALQALVMYRE